MFCFRTSIYQSRDKLALLPDGKLRHFIKNPDLDDDANDNIQQMDDSKSDEPSPWVHDYIQGKYCMDMVNTSFISTRHCTRSKTGWISVNLN